jgi:single-strand DNA-binding protein
MPASKQRPSNPASASTRKTTPAAKPKPQYAERIPGSLSGNLTFDPELRFTPSGRAVANCQIAVQDRVQNADGVWEDTEAEFWRLNVWGGMAETVANRLSKGDRVVAVGYFQDRTWSNAEGEEQTTTEFTATDIGPSMLFRDVKLAPRAQRSTPRAKAQEDIPF